MAMVSCPKGHWYDTAESFECPYCKNAGTPSIGSTTPVFGDVGKTQPVYDAAPTPTPTSTGGSASDMGKTVPLIREKIGIDPVVGWLVCVEGNDKGKDFRIHADNNFLGRSEGMDISINDETISRENHSIISYDSRNKNFYIVFSGGRSLSLLNGEPVYSTIQLKPYDLIEVGDTKLRFIPFCGENFNWL
jgi:pSer/pThr/pTyr-binding forkhead associated (FHA) protein